MTGRGHRLSTTNDGGSPLFNFRLGKGEAELLDRFARERSMTRSDVCREALRRFLAQEPEEAPRAS